MIVDTYHPLTTPCINEVSVDLDESFALIDGFLAFHEEETVEVCLASHSIQIYAPNSDAALSIRRDKYTKYVLIHLRQYLVGSRRHLVNDRNCFLLDPVTDPEEEKETDTQAA